MIVSVTPLTNASAGHATVSSVSYTSRGSTEGPECGAPPIKYKLFWEDDFKGSELGPQWTAYNNCTHGQEAQVCYSPVCDCCTNIV